MSNFTSYFNNLKKIAKRFNFDCIENTHTHTHTHTVGVYALKSNLLACYK